MMRLLLERLLSKLGYVSYCNAYEMAMKQTRPNYISVMENINAMLAQCNSEIQKKLFLEYAIEVISIDLQAEGLCACMYNPRHPECSAAFPFFYFDESGQLHYIGTDIPENIELDFAQHRVVSCIYEPDKVLSALEHIALVGFSKEKSARNVSASFYPDINLAFVENGFHHTAAAIAKHAGKINANVIALHTLFPHVDIDPLGRYWLNRHTNQPLELLSFSGKVSDPRCALLYQLARLRHEPLKICS